MSYAERAMKTNDRRYQNIYRKLGYRTRDMRAERSQAVEDMQELRAEYKELYGKRAYHGWDAETLKQKISEYK